MSATDLAERAETLYQERIRDLVETEENIGKMLVLDVESGDYAIDDTGLQSAHILRKEHPNAALYGLRIGYTAAESFGGVLERTPR